MSKGISSKESTIPDWFDLDSYAEAKYFTAEEWFYNLLDRSSAMSEACSGHFYICSRKFLRSRNNPLKFKYVTRKKSKKAFFFTSPIQPLETRVIHGAGGILSRQRGEYFCPWKIVDGEIYSDGSEFDKNELFHDYRFKEHERIKKIIEDGAQKEQCFYEDSWMFSGKNKHYIELDISLPNSTLISAFKTYLEQIDRPQDRVKTPSYKTKLQTLHSYHVLPILDLWIWAHLKQVYIRPTDVADLLDVTYRRLTETLEVRAEEVISHSFLSDLSSHLSIERDNNENKE
ncbi:MAG: DUF6387 family protein [Pseudomonadales bacterium]